jgi:hypothetical protein
MLSHNDFRRARYSISERGYFLFGLRENELVEN